MGKRGNCELDGRMHLHENAPNVDKVDEKQLYWYKERRAAAALTT